MEKPKDKSIFNTHTHIFTIDHVPNYFTKKLIPVFYRIFSMRFIKCYYHKCTQRGNIKLRKTIHKLKKIKYLFLFLLRKTIVLNWAYLLIRFLVRWGYKIFSNITRLDLLLNKRNKEALNRYLTMGRYSVGYKTQADIYHLLNKSYAPHTKFVVLSMDMEYMEAGKPAQSYLSQIDELAKLSQKNKDLSAFIAIDPRRIEETRKLKGTANFENYSIRKLKKGIFSGIKLYPALGYFPFDKNLISIYKFARDYQIPITTHCSQGTVYYRGKKKEQWNRHPIFTYAKNASNTEEPIPLPQAGNYDFTTNFSHPLNYHALLSQKLLSKYIPEAPDLSKLKICLAHFGGEEQWKKYNDDNWNSYNNIISHTTKEEYLKNINTLQASVRTIWWNASWLSIIYDLLIKYENVYADTSFILHDTALFPLLKHLLEDEKVKDKILFGTDYYVVSHKKNEKNLYHDLRSYLGEELFYQISNTNPRRFLSSRIKTF